MTITKHFEDRLNERFGLTVNDIKKEKFERVTGLEAEALGLNAEHGASFLVIRNRALAMVVKNNALITVLYATEPANK